MLIIPRTVLLWLFFLPASCAETEVLGRTCDGSPRCKDVWSLLQAHLEVKTGITEDVPVKSHDAYKAALGRYRGAVDKLMAAVSRPMERKAPAAGSMDGVLAELLVLTTEADVLSNRIEQFVLRLGPEKEAAGEKPINTQSVHGAAGMVALHQPAVHIVSNPAMLPLGAVQLARRHDNMGLGYMASMAPQAQQQPMLDGNTEPGARKGKMWIVMVLLVLTILVIGATTVIASPFNILEPGKKAEQPTRYNFLQVVLPFWVPTVPNSHGYSFFLLFLVVLLCAASVTYWLGMLVLRAGHAVIPQLVTRGPDYGLYASPILRIATAAVIGATPMVLCTRRKDLQGKWEQWMYLGLRLLIMLILNLVAVAQSFLVAKQMDAMVARDFRMWWYSAAVIILGLVCTVLGHMANYYVQNIMGMRWRAFLTSYFLDLYMARRTYYTIDPSTLDNPDQRIQEDALKMTTGLLEFVFSLIASLMTIVSFSAVLWTLMPALTVSGVVYACLGSFIALGITWGLVRLNYRLQRSEADFRFSLVHIRNNAEAIAFYRGEAREKEITKSRFASVLAVTSQNIGLMSLNRGFTEFYYNFANVLPALILCGAYFHGNFELGAYSQATSAFATTVASLSFVVDQIEVISDLATASNRLGSLLSVLKRPDEPSGIQSVSLAEPQVKIPNLTVNKPGTDCVLIRSLSLAVGGEGGPARLLIVGNSGVGKSSLLRVLAGLWQAGSGEVARPPDSECLFMPQKPYMPLGNLRTQLCYPDIDGSAESSVEDTELRVLLERVGLGNLPDRYPDGFDAVCDWGRVLSLGEQQRLASVRCFIQRPKLTVLDEATSALSEQDEKKLYEHLWQRKLSYVSVAHRDSLVRYHDAVLELSGGAEWKLHGADEYRTMLARRK